MALTPGPPMHLSTDRWRRTSPFAMIHFVWTTAKGVADGWGRVAATFGITAVLLRYRTYLAAGVAIGMSALASVAVLRWWFFRYRVAEDRIFIREGVVNRTVLDIPFDRIQGINVNRRLVERVVGLVTVVIDTPGTRAAEGHLPSVHPEVADQVLRRVEAHRGRGADDEPAAHPDPVEPEGRILEKLSATDLVRLGLANPPVLLLAFLPVAYGVRLDDWLMAMFGFFDTAKTTLGGYGVLGTLVTAAALGLGLLILGSAGGIVHKGVKYHGFTVWREGSAFCSRAGLFTRRQVAVRIRKMQQLRLDQGLAYRWFRRYRLSCPTIGMPLDADEDDSGPDADGLDIPFADGEVVEKLRAHVFRREGRSLSLLPEAGTFTRVSRYYLRARALRLCLVTLPAGVGMLFIVLSLWMHLVERGMRESGAEMGMAEHSELWTQFFHNLGVAAGTWSVACILLAIPISWQRWRRRGYMYDKDGLASRTGVLGYGVEALLFRKAQTVTVKQSPLQRRHGLATLVVGTACGSVSIPYIDHGEACRLRDYVLYRAESSERRWY
ncbi:MAG: PH domain-containing protein [Gemmatimonadota bacterium]|nr:PH domain-containing protein [Gemmatimonadota bacterium]